MKIAILGFGRMGSWLAAMLSKTHDVVVQDPAGPGGPSVGQARRVNGLEAVGEFKPDMLLNCVPLGLTVEAFDAALPYLPEHCVLSDIASVKTGLAAYYSSAGRAFVSTHPMFGPSYANDSNLHEQSAIVIKESYDEGKKFWRAFYESCGIRVFEEDFEGHDLTVAYSLGTPFASTMVFAACMKHLDAPGTNFKKHLQIARGLFAEDDRLLAEVLFNPYTVRRLELINSQLAYLTHIIKDRDHEEMGKLLARLRANIQNV